MPNRILTVGIMYKDVPWYFTDQDCFNENQKVQLKNYDPQVDQMPASLRKHIYKHLQTCRKCSDLLANFGWNKLPVIHLPGVH
jgi:hypothetical protein